MDEEKNDNKINKEVYSDRERINNNIREKVKGKEKQVIYAMFVFLLCMLLYSIYQNFTYKSSDNTKEIEKQLEIFQENVYQKPVRAFKDYKKLEEYVEEYENILKQNNIDTLRLNQLENKIKQIENGQK